MQKTTVSIPFMLLGILFNICLVASNLLETKVVQVFGITATAGLIVFPISYIINVCDEQDEDRFQREKLLAACHRFDTGG